MAPKQNVTGDAAPGFADRRGALARRRQAARWGDACLHCEGYQRSEQIPSSAGARGVTAGRGRFLPAAQPVSPA